MLLVLQIIAILFMITMMFIGIWGFILANQAYNQLRYQNYLLEKLTQNIYMLNFKKEAASSSDKKDNPLIYDEEKKERA